MNDGVATPTRFNLASLDPRTLYPTQENVILVTNCVQSVQSQLEQDRTRLRQSPDNAQAREFRNESVHYLALLNDWISQARVVLQQPQAQQRPGRSPAGATPPRAPSSPWCGNGSSRRETISAY